MKEQQGVEEELIKLAFLLQRLPVVQNLCC